VGSLWWVREALPAEKGTWPSLYTTIGKVKLDYEGGGEGPNDGRRHRTCGRGGTSRGASILGWAGTGQATDHNAFNETEETTPDGKPLTDEKKTPPCPEKKNRSIFGERGRALRRSKTRR